MKERIPPRESDRKIASLVPATERSGENASCPPDEELAAFVENKLKGKPYQAMLGHLETCSLCRHHWVEASTFLETCEPDDPVPEKIRPLSRGLRIFMPRIDLKIAAPIVVGVLGLFVILLIPVSPALETQINSGYASIPTQNKPTQSMQNFPLPWISKELAFSENQLPISARAYRAGLWWGYQILSGIEKTVFPDRFTPPRKSSWAKTQWVDYYELGRWMVLVWALTKLDPDALEREQWIQHQHVSDQLVAKFSKLPDTDEQANRALNSLGSLQSLLKQDPTQLEYATRLRRRLELVIQQLAH